ncbi:uncharacterized protein Z520_09073 [Fonsecaea multimorphosa CBS 102226]|uniref:LIM zinc-binding domain-containing protein n=1 Tax=Fonsecaea multimorphosa CBS 102226 TaxID=1442371 RepID=A0A0D2JP73_9EURO|nr:uncharacterized protein Z520_09073 [Fonsecaea multimorphosa CBS 102226]KIX95157.1 hypothetical protein Z520_09073 [Fonsecaea multimorphosa CBS 102226]OAL20877.1 hypothetical protein AYO22_08505 [Fonsecaea multimorphosa]
MPPREPTFASKYSHRLPASYLDSLRNNRPARPTGSRPAPFSPRNYGSSTSQSSLARSDSAPTTGSKHGDILDDCGDEPPTVQKSFSFSSTSKGRPLAQPPDNDRPILNGRKVSPTAIVQVPTIAHEGGYVESTTRRLEKEEAHSIREALERIDQKDEERRIYEAAKDEAAELVWKHQYPKAAEEEKVAPYRNPDLKAREKRQSSGHRQVSGSRKVSFPTPDNKIYEEPEPEEEISRVSIPPPSVDLPLRAKSRNKLPWLRTKGPEKADDPAQVPQGKKFDRFEIHRNPPTQSRKAEYTENTPPRTPAVDVIEEVDTPNSTGTLEIRSEEIRAATSMKRKDRSPNLPTPTAVSDQLGRPIVSFNPTWKRPSDSPRTSEDVERPVVKLTESPAMRPLPKPFTTVPEVSVSAPVIPTINIPDDGPVIPVINVQEDDVSPTIPIINLPNQSHGAPKPSRPLPKHSSSAPTKSGSTVVKTPSQRLPWLSSRQSMPTVSCSSCALPISGRIVTASGSNSRDLKARFHPECFTCHHCATPLECVSFYPEPDSSRLSRLGISSTSDADPANPPALTPDQLTLLEKDPLRFFCHLDFHEFFSPRCRSCKTPIEGEIVIACGQSYHVDHFFCAECGDPFSSSTPFVEGNDGYAYCVRCHTKRTSARCRGCKLAILDEITVEALGGKWHGDCFVCYECSGGFGDEGRFFVREVHVEPTDKEKRKGVMRKVEERAVCGGCEERRLKA